MPPITKAQLMDDPRKQCFYCVLKKYKDKAKVRIRCRKPSEEVKLFQVGHENNRFDGFTPVLKNDYPDNFDPWDKTTFCPNFSNEAIK